MREPASGLGVSMPVSDSKKTIAPQDCLTYQGLPETSMTAVPLSA